MIDTLATAGLGLVLVFASIVALLCYLNAFATLPSNIWYLVSSCIQTVKVKSAQHGLALLVALLHFIFFSAVGNEVGYGFLAFLLTVLCSVSVLVSIILVNVIACGIFNLIRSFEEIIPEPPLRRRASMTKQSSFSIYWVLFSFCLMICLANAYGVDNWNRQNRQDNSTLAIDFLRFIVQFLRATANGNVGEVFEGFRLDTVSLRVFAPGCLPLVVLKYLPKVADFLNVVTGKGRDSQTGTLLDQLKTNGTVEHCLSSGNIKQSSADITSLWATNSAEFIFSFQQKVVLLGTSETVVRSLNFRSVVDEDVLQFVRVPRGERLNTAHSSTLPKVLYQIGNGPWGTSARNVGARGGNPQYILSTLAKSLTTAFRDQPRRFTSTNPMNLDHPARLAESHVDDDGVVYTVKYSRAFTPADMSGPSENEELVLADVKPRRSN